MVDSKCVMLFEWLGRLSRLLYIFVYARSLHLKAYFASVFSFTLLSGALIFEKITTGKDMLRFRYQKIRLVDTLSR